MCNKQGYVNKQSSRKRLNNGNHCRLLSGLLKLGKTEFVAYRKGYEAKRDLGYYIQRFKRFHGYKAESLDPESAETIRTDKNACYKISRNRRELEKLCGTRHQKTCGKCHGYTK